MNILLLNAGSSSLKCTLKRAAEHLTMLFEEATRVLGINGPGDYYHSGTKAVRR